MATAYALFGVSYAAGAVFLVYTLPFAGVLAILALTVVGILIRDVTQRTALAYIAVVSGIAVSALAFVPWFYV
jgi:hypothetical protein